MLITSHPAPVQNAIDQYRRALDADPVSYLEANNDRLTHAARQAAAQYFGVSARHVALTDSATMGVGLVHNALQVRPDQETITSSQDYFVTHEAMRLAAARNGASFRVFDLHDNARGASADALAGRVIDQIGPRTRVIGLTWVHSSTGLKIPIRQIAEAVAAINRTRAEEDHALIVLDAVHGAGNQDQDFADLGCDFLITSCHKWLFGPRGTGIIVASDRAWAQCRPIIPSFIDDTVLNGWIAGRPPAGETTAARMTPGGFKPFEHIWALPEAFAIHAAFGRGAIHARTNALADHLKQGLAELAHVRVHTPDESALSAGIVSFDVEGVGPAAVVRALRSEGVVASVAPYSTPHVRLTPSVRNMVSELDLAIGALAALGSRRLLSALR